jgi:hypothetical protein
MNQIKAKIIEFVQNKIAELLAVIEKERFENQGEFNGNKFWKSNAGEVVKDKGRNEPLVDLGSLKSEMTDKTNWQKEIKLSINDTTVDITISRKESFNDPKYNKLQVGFSTPGYISPRGNKIGPKVVPGRNFQEINDQDIDWLVNELITAVEKEFK